ncbi:MAG: hypothetical protein GEU73_08420 [Chloroflexi bacterium]|nr:hypothetical protein [Chloroflexota bacterium]
MAQRVGIETLSESTVTRARGKQAAEKLLGLLREDEVDLYVDNAEVLSTSFLDAIVLELGAASALPGLTFITSEPTVVSKLERIAAIRQASLHVRGPNRRARLAIQPSRRSTAATFSPEKVPAPHH